MYQFSLRNMLVAVGCLSVIFAYFSFRLSAGPHDFWVVPYSFLGGPLVLGPSVGGVMGALAGRFWRGVYIGMVIGVIVGPYLGFALWRAI